MFKQINEEQLIIKKSIIILNLHVLFELIEVSKLFSKKKFVVGYVLFLLYDRNKFIFIF